VSVDSHHCHANWAVSLGGISLPVLADFHPKGAVAQSFGLYLADRGITDRATVIYDANGVVHHVSSVTPAGQRNIEELVVLCEEMDSAFEGDLNAQPEPEGVTGDVSLFIKSHCGFSLRALNGVTNLHLQDAVTVRNVSDEPAALAELEKLTGKQQAPMLAVDGKPIVDSEAILRHLVTKATGYWD
jgi:hypothetical protein